MAAPDRTEHPLLAFARSQAASGPQLARRAFERGLAVTAADGSERPIPIGLLPLIVADADIDARRQLATRLGEATLRVARWRMQNEREAVLGALSPAERRIVVDGWQATEILATARIDFLIADRPVALEVNSTIPAMQGYSDIAANAWIETFLPADVERVVAANGSNTRALLQALQSLHVRARGTGARTIAILCRRNDAQLTELRHIERSFAAAGVEARLAFPDQLDWSDGRLTLQRRPIDLLYRHLFAHRLDAQPCAALEAALTHRGATGTLVLNAATPHLEMKSTFAVLSMATADAVLASAIGLTDDERDAADRAVPWTRPLRSGPGRLPDGSSVPQLVDAIASDPQRFVLKRAWSYGGSEVFVGRAAGSADFSRRLEASQPGARDWRDLCERAARDPRGGGFIVQQAIAAPRSEQWLCTPDKVEHAAVTTDYAAYASIGTAPAWGGVARAAGTDVVNIVGGGGVVPVLRASVADALWRALEASPGSTACSERG